jgi:DNA-binding IclR family transcriptional regulator
MDRYRSLLDQFAERIEALRKLDPREPFDTKTLAELTGFPLEQVRRLLLVLHRKGRIAKIGTSNRFYMYVITPKSIRKDTRRKQQNLKNTKQQFLDKDFKQFSMINRTNTNLEEYKIHLITTQQLHLFN